MCNFLSAVVLKNGDVLTHPMLDSHSDLVTYFKLPDTRTYHQHFAKVELTPVDWMDASTWQFRLDEETAPGWWEDVAESVEAKLRARADKMILRDGEHRLIVDGCWIIGGTAKVRDIRSGRIVRVLGSAKLSDVRGNASVSGVRDNASVSGVRGNASVSDVRGNASVSYVGDNASVSDVWGNASVSDVRGNASVSYVGDNASVSDVWGNASVSDVWGNASVSAVWGNASVSGVGDTVERLDASAKAAIARGVK